MAVVDPARPLFVIRALLMGVIACLVVSGITAFPLTAELTAITKAMGAVPGGHYDGLLGWLVTVRDGLAATDARFPFLAYGTDWLAFAHLVIAALFLGPYRQPVRNLWVLQ